MARRGTRGSCGGSRKSRRTSCSSHEISSPEVQMRLIRYRYGMALAAPLLSLFASSLPAQVAQQAAAPPVAERRAHVDTLHGIARSDDYFWLRVKSDPSVRAYLEAENAYANAVLAPLAPLREKLYQEMLSHIKIGRAHV